MPKIGVFAGHDDDTWDKLGAKGVYTNLEADGDYEEYDGNIQMAKETVRLLEQHSNIKVFFPQKNGRDMSLAERVRYCEDNNLDFVIFIHSNASASREATGACAFHYPGTEEYAKYYADEMDKLGYPLWQGGTYECQPGTWSWFYVVRKTTMPVALTENFFFSNPHELEKYLLAPGQFEAIAGIHYRAACRYFNINPKGEEKLSKYVITGGLDYEMITEVTSYVLAKEWWARFNFDGKGTNPTLETGGLGPAELKEFEAWLKEHGWYYEVLER